MMNKKNVRFIVAAVTFVVFIMINMACRSAPVTVPVQTFSQVHTPAISQVTEDSIWDYYGGPFFRIRVPAAKDFNSLGLVFYETTFTKTSDIDNYSIRENTQGESFLYYKLLEKAQVLGADDIVNVTMDKITSEKKVIMTNSTSIITEEKWFGSALAIKYTNTILIDFLEPEPITNVPGYSIILQSGNLEQEARSRAGQAAGQESGRAGIQALMRAVR
jgi:hypothetical protein